ncbi:MAG: bifunctional diguanylate cyclase/phosphodiesterase [Ruminococcus sp.]|nr:bifunctional diguanylate cyclase/phosphodiesterase [Ruminococcus sp.]
MEKYQFDSAAKAALEKLRVPLAVYQFIDKRVVTILLSDGFCELFGFDNKDDAYYVMDHDMYRATHPEDRARAADAAYRFATEGGRYEVVYRTLTRNKTDYIIVHSLGEHVMTEDGVRLAYIWYTDEGRYTSDSDGKDKALNDAMKNIVREENMIKSGYCDYLTGLPNMSYFFELARERRRSFCESGKTAALLYMDLCGMKYFNRKYSFAEGDNLLRSFADILKLYFGNENCSRFGSDHFCVITDAEGLEDTLTEIFTEFRAADSDKSLPVRVGIYLDRNGVDDISTECDRAKYACDTMRSTYVSSFRYFSDEMHAKNESRQYFIDNLDKVIREGWIEVYYQPIIRSANGTVCDVEALVRWKDPVRGMMMPSQFIPVLEEANLIYMLDLFVTEQVLEKMKKQAEAGLFVVSESVNLSRADFTACDIVEEMRRRVDAAGFSRDKINIEVTESVIGSDFEFMKSQIERFRSLGFRVWMDDFGSGYSTLDVLQSIRFDLIKFDMRFMKEFDTSEKSRIMLTELIRMAISLGVDTVCEGVETKEQADFLREIGCTMMQGYYFCRPIPFEKILERYQKVIQIGFENPEESGYYAAVGKINLYDLAILSNEDQE